MSEMSVDELENLTHLLGFPKNWQILPIESLCLQVTSGGTPSRKNPEFYKDGKIIWLKTQELKDWYIEDSQEKITQEALKKSAAKLLPINTVLMAMYGDGKTITSLGILRKEAATNQACCALVPNLDRCEPLYLFYLLKFHRDHLIKLALGGAQRNLSVKTIRNFKVKVPSLSIQRKIVRVLSVYDDLIEKNTKRIEILEEMARSLYREWFVKFRFPGYEIVKMVDSELGLIPEGWQVKKVNEIVKRLKVGVTYKEADIDELGCVPIIDQSRSDFLGFHKNNPDHIASSEKPIVIFGDHTCKMQLMVEPFSLAPNVVPFVSKGNLPISYLYFLVNSLVTTKEYKRHWTELTNQQVIIATDDSPKNFTDFVKTIFEVNNSLRKKNFNLCRTRDLLIPKLISGEIDWL